MTPSSSPRTITRTKLESLSKSAGDGPVLSIFHPTDRVIVESEENSLRFKNLIHDAADQLKARGLRRSDVDHFLEPLESLVGDHEFWLHQMEGFALYRSRETFEYFRLPHKVPERAFLDDHPRIKHLLPAVWPQARFYILAISQNSVRLLECDDFAWEEVDLGSLDIPTSLEEALRYDDLQKPELQSHPLSGPGRAGERGRGGIKHGFHGHGDEKGDNKEAIRRYFKAVDDGLMTRLGTEATPLIIAAVDYEFGIYREVSGYKHILDERLEGNFDRAKPADLHAEAMPIIDRRHRKELDGLREQHGSLLPRGLASCDAEETVIAAADGRVETLFLRRDEDQWGIFDPDSRTVKATDDESDEDLHELAARLTIEASGAAYVVGAEEMPCDSPMGAIFRYKYGEPPSV